MTDPDDPRPDDAEASSPWRADSFDRWLAALDITDADLPDAEDLSAGGASGADGDGAADRPAGDDVPDPWADLDLDRVDLSGDQREYLAWHDHQPPVPRLRGSLDDPDPEPG